MAPGRAQHPLDAVEFSLGHYPGADFVRSIRYLRFQHPFGLRTRALGHDRDALEQAIRVWISGGPGLLHRPWRGRWPGEESSSLSPGPAALRSASSELGVPPSGSGEISLCNLWRWKGDLCGGDS